MRFFDFFKRQPIKEVSLSNIVKITDKEYDVLAEMVKNDRYSEAIAEIDRIINYNRNNPSAYDNKAGLLQLMERRDEAIQLYEYNIEKFDDIDAYIELIELYNIDNNEQIAERIVDLCTKMGKNHNKEIPYYILAKSYVFLQKYDYAIDTFNKAIEQNKLNLEVYNIILEDPKHDDIIKQIIKQKIDANKLYDAYCDKAELLSQMDRFIEAIEVYNEAIDLNIQNNCEYESYNDYRNIADIYEVMEDDEKAIYYNSKADELEKKNDDVYAIKNTK